MGATNFASSKSLNIAGMNISLGADVNGNSRVFVDGKEGFAVGAMEDSRNVKSSGSSTTIGDSFTNEQDRLQKTIAFNMHQVAHGHGTRI